jgi:hypothetical protein
MLQEFNDLAQKKRLLGLPATEKAQLEEKMASIATEKGRMDQLCKALTMARSHPSGPMVCLTMPRM